MYSNSFLQASFESIDQQTKLTARAFNAPLKITKTFQEPKQHALMMYMMDASPGMMDGDCYTIKLDVKKNSHAIVTNQASTKIHPANTKGALLTQTIKVEANAVLEYFPEPTILYIDSLFKARTSIELDQAATLCMAEVMTCGRVERDEKFAFQSCSVQTEIKQGEKIIAYEHYQFVPKRHPRHIVGIFEDYTHQATVWFIAPNVSLPFVEKLSELIKSTTRERLLAGVSQFEPTAVVIRILGYTVWEIQSLIQQLWAEARLSLLKLPPLTFRK